MLCRKPPGPSRRGYASTILAVITIVFLRHRSRDAGLHVVPVVLRVACAMPLVLAETERL